MQPGPDAVMIFAAGLGTRMRPLTLDRPKPLIPVAGKALLDHALALADAAGIGLKAVNLHYRPEMIRSHLAGRSDIRFLEEQGRILDTGGGLRNALPLLPVGPVFTMNSDAVWTGPNPFETLRAAWKPDMMEALLLLVPEARATAHAGSGDFDLDTAGRIVRGSDFVYAGAQILDPSRLSAIPDDVFSLNRVWDTAAREGRLFGVVHQGGWCDVGHPAAIPIAEALLDAEARGV